MVSEGYWANSHWASGYWASGYWGQGATVTVAPSIIGARLSSPSRKHLQEVDLIPLIGESLTVIARRKRKMRQENE